jgi:hypothetical protein
MPPAAKIYEAIGALGDRRVEFEDQRHARVVSSDRSKTYQVEISEDGRELSSNDNASYWQGYLGYPAIAVLLMQGLYAVRPEIVDALTGIPWKEMNRQFNNYRRTIEEVLRRAESLGFERSAIEAEVDAVRSALEAFGPRRGVRRRPPAGA